MMKKQYLLPLFLVLFLLTQAQAQVTCCLQEDNIETAEPRKEFEQISEYKMKAILDEEIKLFTNFISHNCEYPEEAEYKMLEGTMRVRIVYDHGFDSIRIIESIDPEIDKMVLDNIAEYVKNFDRVYISAPRLVFDFPIIFRMTNL